MSENETGVAPPEEQLKPDSNSTDEHDPEALPLEPPVIHIIEPNNSSPGDAIRSNALLFLNLDAGNTLVNQVTRTIFHRPGDQSLYANVESYLQEISWILAFTRHNFLTTPIQHTVRTMTRRTVVNGRQTSLELNMAAMYKGLSIAFGAQHIRFSEVETVSEREVITTYTIPPQSSLYVYQRRYRFRDDIWWIADAWGRLWNVSAPPSGYTLLRVPFESFIDADEKIAVSQPLTGRQRVTVQRHIPAQVQGRQTNRQFHNHTRRTRDAVQRVMNDANRP